MSRTLKVHRKEKYRAIELKYSIMMCGVDIELVDPNYLNRVTNTRNKVTCGNCIKIQK